jgi:coenzyme PQQ synthesis protein D (PqqD)
MRLLDRRFVKQNEIPWRVVEGEAVLIDERERELIRLNVVGTAIWTAIDGRRSVREIIASVRDMFEVSEKRAARDVRRFMKRLLRYELLEEIREA